MSEDFFLTLEARLTALRRELETVANKPCGLALTAVQEDSLAVALQYLKAASQHVGAAAAETSVPSILDRLQSMKRKLTAADIQNASLLNYPDPPARVIAAALQLSGLFGKQLRILDRLLQQPPSVPPPVRK